MVIPARSVKIFRIKNRKGYAAICRGHLTEGRSVSQAYDRMHKALKRNGLTIKQEIDPKRLLVNL